MKRIIKLSLLLLALLLPATASAYDFEVDGIYYNINGNNATVTYADENWNAPDYSGDVTIPETVTYNGMTYPVTEIGNNAFLNCSGLTSVIIPNSVTSIGEWTFLNCSGLTSVIIPNSVTSIGEWTFYNCSGLTSVTIGNSVTEIGNHVFGSCCGLTSVTIPNSVSTIGNNAFYNCSGLTSVTIPNSVSTIGNYAFYGCSGLISVTIPNSVSTIGYNAFYGCSGLTSVTIGNSVTEIGNEAFYNCSGLTCVTIPNSVSTIGNYAFYGCSGLISVTIGNSVTTIGNRAFQGCSALVALSFNAISCSDFSSTADLRPFTNLSISNINIGDRVQRIPAYFVNGNTNLTSVTIGNSVTSIGNRAFYGCDNIQTILFNAVNCTSIGYEAFYDVNLTNLQFGDSVKHIPAGLPYFYMYGKTLIIPNSVKTIDAGAFKGSCAGVVIGKGIEDIAAGTFPRGISVAYAKSAEPVPCQPSAFINPQTLYVPAGSKMKYFTAPGWSEFNNIIEGEYTPATAVELDKDNITLYRYASLQLSATVFPDSVSTSSLGWYSLNTNVASVSDNGMVYANGVGETDIIVWADQVSDTCHVKVTPIMVENITLNANHLSMALDETFTLTANATPNNAENRTLEWIIPENDVLLTQLVNNNKLNIGAVGEGTATITVRATDGSGVSATCVVTVEPTVLAASVELDCESAALNEGETLQLTATVLPENATDKTVTWASSDEAVAIVDENGLVTAVAAGTATITATTNDGSDLSSSCTVTVANPVIPVGDNILVMADTTVMHGDIIALPVSMTNDATLMAFQTDIFLPEGFTIVTDEDDEYIITPSGRLSNDHVIMSDNANNGSVRVICYTPNSQPITGNEGDLFYILVQVPDDAEGPYTINLRNTLLTTVDYTEISAPDTSAQIEVSQFIPGDVNDSRTVNVTDIVVTAMYVLDKNPSPFIFEAADMNGDGNVTVTDIMLIAYLINHPTMNAPKRMPALMDCNDRMSGESVSLMAGETRTVSIALDNEMDYTAFQMDLTLPEGLTAGNFQLTDRAGNHAFDVNAIAGNKMRALCYSPAIEVIDGHSGALLTFDVTANATVEGSITVDGIELVTTDCQSVLLNGFAIGVNTATSVNEIVGSKTVARVDYFNLAGQRIDRAESGVTLIVTTYTDGTRTTTKVMK